jgi:hypothetical protein
MLFQQFINMPFDQKKSTTKLKMLMLKLNRKELTSQLRNMGEIHRDGVFYS